MAFARSRILWIWIEQVLYNNETLFSINLYVWLHEGVYTSLAVLFKMEGVCIVYLALVSTFIQS